MSEIKYTVCESHNWNAVEICPWCRIAELEADNERLKELIWNVAGWCYAEACMNLADGIDMREVAVPDFIDKLKKDIPEVAALPIVNAAMMNWKRGSE